MFEENQDGVQEDGVTGTETESETNASTQDAANDPATGEQLEKLKMTLNKVNKTNRELESQLKKATKSLEENQLKVKNLEEQLKNASNDKESAKKIQQLQEKLEEQEREYNLKILEIAKKHALNDFERQIESEIIKQGGGASHLEYLKFQAKKLYTVEQDEDGNFIPIIRNAEGATEKLDKKLGDFVKNDFKDLVNVLKTSEDGQYFMVKAAPGTPTTSAQGSSSSDSVSRANLKKKLQLQYAEARKSPDSKRRLDILGQAMAAGFAQHEIDSYAM